MSTVALPAADSQAVRSAQLQLLCQQAVRVPYVVFVIAAFVVNLLWQYKPHGWLLTWAGSVCGLLLLRSVLCRKCLTRTMGEAETLRWTRIMMGFALANGVVGGTAGWFFFTDLPLVDRALLTMVLLCWCAGAVGTTSAMSKSFVLFAMPFMTPLAVNWLLSDMPEGPYIGVMIVLFMVIQLLTSRDNGRQVVHSLGIGVGNLALIEELKREREEAHAARESAEAASRSKSRFLAAASHDLRQPLHALSLFSAALSETVTQPRVREIARNIEVSVDSLGNLFEALLDISKLDAGIITPQARSVHVQVLLKRLGNEFKPQADAKGLSFRVNKFEGKVETDPLLVERILRNLLDNAIRYTESGGVSLSASVSAGQVEIAVTDTGLGIPATEREHIYEEFYQLNNLARDSRKGLGLGLATVRRIVDLLGGVLDLRSAPGKGSTFTLRLPLQETTRSVRLPAEAEPPRIAIDLTGEVILVIEDDMYARAAMQTLLDQWGCEPLLASTIEDAFQVVALAPKRPGIILADYRLGNGVTGAQAIEAMVAKIGPVPSILITGDTDPQRIRDAQATGHLLLHKPVKATVLRAEIAALLTTGVSLSTPATSF